MTFQSASSAFPPTLSKLLLFDFTKQRHASPSHSHSPRCTILGLETSVMSIKGKRQGWSVAPLGTVLREQNWAAQGRNKAGWWGHLISFRWQTCGNATVLIYLLSTTWSAFHIFTFTCFPLEDGSWKYLYTQDSRHIYL